LFYPLKSSKQLRTGHPQLLFNDFGEVYRRYSYLFTDALEVETGTEKIRLVGNEFAKRGVGFGN
jgi:hypothetical protein